MIRDERKRREEKAKKRTAKILSPLSSPRGNLSQSEGYLACLLAPSFLFFL